MKDPRLPALRAGHPDSIERTRGRKAIGYAATRQCDGLREKVSTVNLTELGKRLSGLHDSVAAVGTEARDHPAGNGKLVGGSAAGSRVTTSRSGLPQVICRPGRQAKVPGVKAGFRLRAKVRAEQDHGWQHGSPLLALSRYCARHLQSSCTTQVKTHGPRSSHPLLAGADRVPGRNPVQANLAVKGTAPTEAAAAASINGNNQSTAENGHRTASPTEGGHYLDRREGERRSHEILSRLLHDPSSVRSSGTMSSTFDYVMTEHPAWLSSGDIRQRILITPDDTRWNVSVRAGKLALSPLDSATGRAPRADVFILPNNMLSDVPQLRRALGELGRVIRFRNENLWDAIATAIIRQVIRAAQSKKLYRAFCAAYGKHVKLANRETCSLFPTPTAVLQLSDAEFSAVGMAFKRRGLRAAAEAFLDYGAKWGNLTPSALIQDLQGVSRIGAWTAGAAVADWSNDWSLYPYADLAVRTWATRAAPCYSWPDDESTFGHLWRTLAGDHLSTLTLLTLAWGSQHGDIG